MAPMCWHPSSDLPRKDKLDCRLDFFIQRESCPGNKSESDAMSAHFGLSVTTPRGCIHLGDGHEGGGCDDSAGGHTSGSEPATSLGDGAAPRFFCVCRLQDADLIRREDVTPWLPWPKIYNAYSRNQTVGQVIFYPNPPSEEAGNNETGVSQAFASEGGFGYDPETGTVTLPGPGVYELSYAAKVVRKGQSGNDPRIYDLVTKGWGNQTTPKAWPSKWTTYADMTGADHQSVLLMSTDFMSHPWSIDLPGGPGHVLASVDGDSLNDKKPYIQDTMQCYLAKGSCLSIVQVNSTPTDAHLILKNTKSVSLYRVQGFTYVPLAVAPGDTVVSSAGGLSLTGTSTGQVHIPITGTYKISLRQRVQRQPTDGTDTWHFELTQRTNPSKRIDTDRWTNMTWEADAAFSSTQDFVLSSEMVVWLKAGDTYTALIEVSGDAFTPGKGHSPVRASQATTEPPGDGYPFANALYMRFLG